VSEAIRLPIFIAFVFKEMLQVWCDFVLQVGHRWHADATLGAAFSDILDSGKSATSG
jgi:hypothetical protein